MASREKAAKDALAGALRPVDWLGLRPPRPRSPRDRVLARAAVGIAIAAAFAAAGHRLAGGVVAAVAVALSAASFASPRFRDAFDRALSRLGRLLGGAAAWALLAPVYLAVFPALRGWWRLSGQDPLQLRPRPGATLWIASEPRERRARLASAMFAAEGREHRGRPLAASAALLVALAVCAELALRVYGMGQPVLYVADPQAGYYPAPNQSLRVPGGRVETNAWGMRSPPVPAEKPAGTFRVLLLGDSTLWGGIYVDQQALYSRRAERALRSAAGGRPVELLAMGVNAWGPFHELGWVDRFGTLGADLAIVCMPIGDIYRPLYGLSKVPFIAADRPPRLALEEALGFAAWKLREAQLGPTSEAELAFHGDRGVRAYVELARALRARGAEVMFEVLPSRAASAGAPPPGEARDVERLRAALAADAPTHLAFPAGLFAGRGDPARLYSDGWHLDTAGHAVYAEFLAAEISTRSEAWRAWRASGEGRP